MPLRSDRETHYVASYLEFWERPRDWDEAGLESAVSSFAPVRAWLNQLTTGLHVASLRIAMRRVAAKHPRPPPLDPIRSAYFVQLSAEREERVSERMAAGVCVYCANGGAVYVAAWTDRANRTRVMSPRSPQWVPAPLQEVAGACSCVAGDDLAKEAGWSDETRRRFVRLRLTHAEFIALRDQVAAMPCTGARAEEAPADDF